LLLSVEGVSKAFSRVRVLDGVRFELRAGEVHVLAGENGAGKTTLIKILAGVHTDYSGEVRLDGRPVRFRSPQEAAARGISTIHQEMSLVESMSVRDNIFLGRELAKAGAWMDFRSEAARAKSVLAGFGIPVDLDRAVGDYPVAVRQMIEIAKALVYRAGIFIMDEPTSALNEFETERLFAMIADLKSRGCGIIYISHRMEEIYEIGDRITVLRDGRYVGTAAAADLPPDRLVGWMVGRELSGQFPPRRGVRGPKVLEVENLRIADPAGVRRWAVEGVTFDLHAGEILGVAGLHGSGKSELADGLFGAHGRPAGGTVRLRGRAFAARSPRDSVASGLALLTSDRKGTGLVPIMSVGRNISLAAIRDFSPRGWVRRPDEEDAAAGYVKSLGIRTRSLEQEVRTLSGGNQQKVVIAKWLLAEPEILLLDEPTIGIDVGAKRDIYELMNTWTASGMAILLVTSEIEELLAMSDRILAMHRGRVIAEFPRGSATREGVIRAAMGEAS